ncbi:hypothetical protein CQ10_10530 [Bradyrhizobium valentinum]|nr:hypothetical protein CQ10_10530 [Bradyrhizobium valentinum]
MSAYIVIASGTNAPPVIASEAKQIHLTLRRSMDCFVAEFIIGPAEGRTRWPLAMTQAWYN